VTWTPTTGAPAHGGWRKRSPASIAGFVPADQRADVAEDRPLPIGHHATNSQPSTVRDMLEVLDVLPGQRVLDVGSGSGWTTALLAELTGPEGSVVGVELVPELAVWGAANLAALDLPWAGVRVAAPGVLGAPDLAPFDRILVSAEARRLPGALVDQLGDGGRMVIPVAGRMEVVVRHGTEVAIRRFGHYSFVPLR
jgi:protein-L-isoaspartate(D-aspartate) O-methyltransferase